MLLDVTAISTDLFTMNDLLLFPNVKIDDDVIDDTLNEPLENIDLNNVFDDHIPKYLQLLWNRQIQLKFSAMTELPSQPLK